MNYSGNTPMVDITYKFNGRIAHIYAKLEYYNPSGSIKDRIVSYIIDKATEAGELKSGQPIVETTSGNTGIALAAYGALTKHPVHIFMPDWASNERKQLMQMYGANLHLVSKEEGGFEASLVNTKQLAKTLGAFQLNQFDNLNNAKAHYNGTGLEIAKALPDVTDFISGVGSGGTIMGIGQRLKEANGARIIAIEPECAQIIAGKKATRQHKIEGIGDDFIPGIFSKNSIDQLIPIDDDDAVAMASKFAKELGLGIGISSGANFLGAVLANTDDNKKVATVFADDNKKYLSTSLANPIIRDDMLSSQIELLEVKY